MSRFKLTAFITFVVTLLLFAAGQAHALSIEEIGSDEVVGDFVVGPGKAEVFLEPGQTKIVEMLITNRLGVERTFSLSTEDFAGTQSTNQTVVLFGEADGPYSLKDFIQPEVEEVRLAHGERARIPVTVTAPAGAEPGGLYGAVLVSITSQPGDEAEAAGASSGTAVVSRIASLFFVRVAGDVVEEGAMTDFGLKGDRTILFSTPLTFEVLFENNGNVHLNPYGLITITNSLGEVIGEREVEPWFVLPDALRLREVSWDRPLLIGKYTATAQINRGYDDIIDEASVSFWVLPYKPIALGLGGIVILVLLLYFIRSKFEIKRKSKV